MNTYKINLRNVAFTGLLLIAIGYAFALIETAYFASEYLPESRSEFICDFMSAMICGGGGSLLLFAVISKTIFEIKKLKTI